MSIKNIYCVGRNYILHAQELNNPVPKAPLIFTKPTHAYVLAEGQALKMPAKKGKIHYETELVVHIGKSYYPQAKADELIDKFAIGIDFTLRELQEELKKKGYPWLAAKGFPNSALVSPWLPFEGVEALAKYDFALVQNDKEVQRGNIKDMIFDLSTLVNYIGLEFGLGPGDIIFTGTPAGVGEIRNGDHLVLTWQGNKVGECVIEL
mgnify:CR=1 FL=1